MVLNESDMGTFGHVWVDSTEGSLAIVHKEELMVGVTRWGETTLASLGSSSYFSLYFNYI